MSLSLLAERIIGEWVSKQAESEPDYRVGAMSWEARWNLAFGGREWSKRIEGERYRNTGRHRAALDLPQYDVEV